MVVAVGDFDSAEVAAEIERLFAGDRAGEAERARPVEPAQEDLRVSVLRRPFEGHRVDLSWPAARFADRDATLLDLLAYVLGECESSRLIRGIREQAGLVDRIDAGAYTPLDRGVFSIGYQTDAARLLEATRRIVEETDRLRHEPVSRAELERARINFLASEQFDRESVSGLASKLGSFEAMGGGWEREADVIRILETATPGDLQRVAREYLRPEALTLAALIPEDTDPGLDESALRDAITRAYEGRPAADPNAAAPPHDAKADAARTSPRLESSAATGNAPSPASPRPRTPRIGAGRKTPDGAGERFDAELSNGLRLHVLRRSEIPVAAVRFACRGGLLAETPETSGLTPLRRRDANPRHATTFRRRVRAGDRGPGRGHRGLLRPQLDRPDPRLPEREPRARTRALRGRPARAALRPGGDRARATGDPGRPRAPRGPTRPEGLPALCRNGVRVPSLSHERHRPTRDSHPIHRRRSRRPTRSVSCGADPLGRRDRRRRRPRGRRGHAGASALRAARPRDGEPERRRDDGPGRPARRGAAERGGCASAS